MENKGLKGFSIAFGIAVFLVILLGVMRLFRFSLLVFGVSGFIFLVWGMFLAKADDELKKHKAPSKKLPKAKSALQKKLVKQIELAREEVAQREEAIRALEEKTAYFIRKVYAEWIPEKQTDRALFLSYEALKREHSTEVNAELKLNCDQIVEQHRSEIDFLYSEIHYWSTVERKYTRAYEQIAKSQEQVRLLQKKLKQKEQKVQREEAISKEMQAYLDQKSNKSENLLQDPIYQNMHFSDVKNEVQQQLDELELGIAQTENQIEDLELLTQNYHQLKSNMGHIGTAIENDMAQEIRELSKQLEAL